MNKYISREALAAEMKKRQDAAEKWLREAKDHETAVRADAVLTFLSEVKLTLDAIPAADVVPVRHGRWKPHSKVETPIFHCSVCGGAALHAFGKQCKSDYCPNCGADMREVEHE